jgi:AraC family transcriptional regulator of adaptative response / DNA-3-methyladenine glycosylase II
MLSPEICEQARLARDPRFDGLFFILVKTTKIFCRNTCKVRAPLVRNISFASSAQQALALGYRPCLRCRPDSAPQSSAWQGVHTTVQRAMKLLNERVDVSVQSIADSLGISARYLNKLFQENFEMSAKRYRLYQQVLMAKNLLQQTALSVEDVACNVGFSSARQLQQHTKTYLKLTPSDIRKNTAKKAMGLTQNVSLLLQYRPPYNWPQVRDFFAQRIISGNESVSEQGMTKVLRIKRQVAEIKDASINVDAFVEVLVKIKHEPDNNGFRLEFNAEFAKYALALSAVVKRILDVDANPQLITQALLNAGLLPDEIVPGLRIPGVASEFEAGCRAIVGQQVSVKAAINKVNELYHAFATQDKKQFTAPQLIAQDPLDFLKMPGARKQSLIELASYYYRLEGIESTHKTDGSTTLAPILAPQTAEHHIDNLLNIKGIGPWTVSYIKMRGAADADVWLNTDLIIKQQSARLISEGRTLKSELAAPWRSYLTLNLWSLSSSSIVSPVKGKNTNVGKKMQTSKRA